MSHALDFMTISYRESFHQAVLTGISRMFFGVELPLFLNVQRSYFERLRVYFNKKNILIDKGDKIFDYDGNEIPVQVQK